MSRPGFGAIGRSEMHGTAIGITADRFQEPAPHPDLPPFL
jgi:hypothetical protein